MSVEIKNCRSCDSNNLIPILSLGNQCVTNFVESSSGDEVRCPLDLVLCDNCKLLQMLHNSPPEAMWGDQYWYKSGISTTIKNDLNDIVNKSKKLVSLEKGDIVVDIGCNDGTLLGFYNISGLRTVGFEPSGNVAREASEKGFEVINNFFNAENFKEKFGDKKAKIITAISMFYDLENPNQFLKDIKECLDKDGLFVIQQNYLVTMLEQNAFDNICHEHREYYSFTSLKKILEKHSLEIFDISQSDINGGSIRTYIRFKENVNLRGFEGSEARLSEIEEYESGLGLDTLKPYKEFADRINGIKERLMTFLKREKEKGKRIYLYGASTRGNVVLQYFGLNPDLVTAIADMNPDKWGKKTVGTMIPIISPEELRKENPDYLLVMVWHFFDEIKRQEDDWFQKGGKFIVALPEFKVVEKD
ncbi:MAG: class I SAM-dependent methyltransferase [archaeon]|nr:class I SAM-dependent methyltransferase [archaeon]MCR4323974.1 class I SAM-dependent methyltransferase [Nanoarchaeota archaeon]